MISPVQGVRLSAQQVDFNRRMSSLRQGVEFSFQEIIVQFAYIDYFKKQKLLLQPVQIHFTVAVLLHNAHVCLHRFQVSQYFHMNPPPLEEVFHY